MPQPTSSHRLPAPLAKALRVDVPKVRERLDEIVYSSLAPVCWVLAMLYLIFAAAHTFFLPPETAWIMSLTGFVSAIALAALPFSSSGRSIPVHYGHRLAAAVVAVVLVNCALHLQLTGDPNQTTNFMLLVIGIGSFMLRVRWLVGLLVAVILTWVGVAAAQDALRLWSHFAIALLTASLISIGVFIVRRRTLVELEEARMHEQEAARAVRDSEARFRQLANSTSEGILVHHQGIIVDANIMVEEMFGHSHAELIGRHLSDLLVSSERGDSRSFVNAPEGNLFRLNAVRKNGTVFPMELRTRSLNSQGRALGVATVLDLTQRLAAEKIKDEFVSVVSHELRTPLTSIRGALGLMATPQIAADPRRVEHLLNVARSNTDRLIRLINDILDLRRLEAGEVTLEIKLCSAERIVHQAVTEMSPLAENHGVHLEARSDNASLVADPDRLVQTLINLISNAIKFSPRGGTVKVSATTLQDRVLFKVEDQGRGIPKEKLELIFERFQQVDASDSRERGGTGLGLSICRVIVRQHQGQIWAESDGHGSTFYFTLPLYTQGLHEHAPLLTSAGK